MSTTTTEISSNSNSSCRLLDCLNILPFHDQRVFRSQLGHIDFLRLSACCRSLRSSIRNDPILWQALYHRDFLSGAYYAKEMDFVLWCVRTDVNNPCTSDKRADLLENVDWYNTYRRRVSTENNWRYGRCKTTRIDMKSDKDKIDYSSDFDNNRIFITQRKRIGRASGHSYTLQYLPHSNLRTNDNIVYNSTFSISPNVFLLGSDETANHIHVLSGHYIAAYRMSSKKYPNYNVKILSRKYGDVFTTFNIPASYSVEAIEGKWILLVNRLRESHRVTPIIGIMVFDIDNSIMCLGSTDGRWDATRFYKTTNNTAIVYTARIVKDDDTDRIEWALHQFSSNNHVVQLRNGWLCLPEGIKATLIFVQSSYDSYMIIYLCGHSYHDPYIMHSVASSGQSHTPRNCYTIFNHHMPIPLLRAGYTYSISASRPTKLWADLPYNDDQVLQIPDTVSIKHIIGDIYVFITGGYNRIKRRLLVDINTKETIRELKVPNTSWQLDNYTMFGMLCSSRDSDVQTLLEYGEL